MTKDYKESMMDEIITKTCTKCNNTYNLEFFYKDTTRKDGRGLWCKNCCIKQKKSYYDRHRVELAEKSKIYYSLHKRETVRSDKYKDILGLVVGRLTVVRFVETRDWSNYWECRCECGNLVVEKRSSLTRRKKPVMSCGCLRADSRKAIDFSKRKHKLPYGEAGFNKLYRSYQRNAEIRSLPFEINKDIFKNLVTQKCFYCDAFPISAMKVGSGEFLYNGLDRVDNSAGYLQENVVTCCARCNRMKNRMSKDEFFTLIHKISEMDFAKNF